MLNQFNGFPTLINLMIEVLRKDASTSMALIVASPSVLIELPMFWTAGSGILHFLGICPKQSYERELQTASDTAAIPACNIRRRERESTLQTASRPRGRYSQSQRALKNNDAWSDCEDPRKDELYKDLPWQLELALGFTDREFGSWPTSIKNSDDVLSLLAASLKIGGEVIDDSIRKTADVML